MEEKLYTEAEVVGYMRKAVEVYQKGYGKGLRTFSACLGIVGGVSIASLYYVTKKLKALRDSNNQNH